MTRKIEDSDIGGIARITDFEYDRLGRQVSITGYAGSTAQKTQYDYNVKGSIEKITYPDGNDIEYAYNAAGAVTKRTDQREIVTKYVYDNTYKMLKKTASGASIDIAEETYTYDGLGRRISAEKKVNASQISLSQFSYNDLGLVTDANETLFGGAVKQIHYGYDQAGFQTSLTYPDDSSIIITPDFQGKITSIVKSGQTLVEYSYAGSNPVSRTYNQPNVI